MIVRLLQQLALRLSPEVHSCMGQTRALMAMALLAKRCALLRRASRHLVQCQLHVPWPVRFSSLVPTLSSLLTMPGAKFWSQARLVGAPLPRCCGHYGTIA